jgi:hypothetical protein
VGLWHTIESVKGVAAALAHFQIGGKHEELYPDGVPLLSLSDAEGGACPPPNAPFVVPAECDVARGAEQGLGASTPRTQFWW